MRYRPGWLVDIGLILLAVGSRAAFASPLLYDHDSFLFARAVVNYDLSAGVPHPPGYILYVLLGRLLAHLTQDVNQGLIWVGILSGALAGICIYRLGRRIFGAGVGVIGALFYLLGPMIWFYHEIALTYAAEGAFSALVALLAWRTYRGSKGGAYLLCVALGVAGGIRPWLIPQLLPLWLLAFWRFGVWRAVLGLGLVVISSLSWLVPNAASAGGMAAYFSLVRNYGGGLLSEGHLGSLAGTVSAARMMGLWFYLTFGWALAGLIWLLARRWILRKPSSLRVQSGVRIFFACWILPAFLLRLFAHLTMPGYLLIFLPGICLLAAAGIFLAAEDCAAVLGRILPPSSGLRFLGRSQAILGIFLVGILAHHVTTFTMGDSGFTWPIIQAKNRIIHERLEFVRGFSPQETVVFASDMANAAHYYLSDYRVINVFWTPGEQRFGPDRPPQERARWVILFDSQLLSVNGSRESVKRESLPVEVPIFYFALSAGEEVARWKGGYRLVKAAENHFSAAPE
ncbi:MAG: DUF2723 domain-containing protein [Armatimonadetes bacterium]|nr:DUF2723 domain-containing protein [Armatimonadota bacterium]NIM24776.1 DUF2723 domain-containing protein [Armatimonadota bacterium]NIM68665.1 DUF2723 domain-containing protein [Armatimonadota bacterium]NIM76962.1 DUF2723 domain-containing protein [Armatimonadota bacterium]NIN06868.1 DUF2723 domain-containing protein [Armatimonadota bacterium]